MRERLVETLRLHLVTDSALCGERGVLAVVEAAVAGGVSCVQLREKSLPTRAFVERARALKAWLAPRGVPLIINDRVDVALACGADGVHVGQSDMAPAAWTRSTASSPTTPSTAIAATVARHGSGCTAAKAPTSALAEQPTPVTRVIHGWPLESTARRPAASTIRSSAPLTHTTASSCPASAAAASVASAVLAALSTPRVAAARPATLMISEALPRRMPGAPARISSESAALR